MAPWPELDNGTEEKVVEVEDDQEKRKLAKDTDLGEVKQDKEWRVGCKQKSRTEDQKAEQERLSRQSPP